MSTNTDNSAEIGIERHDGVVTLTLDNPQRKNALPPPVWSHLLDALRSVDPDRDRVLLLRGEGDDFCAGAELGAANAMPLNEFMGLVGTVTVALHELPIPTVARVDGVAVGAGMSLALGCDLIVASDRARFAQIFVKRALSPDAGSSWLLPRLIGLARAKQLALTGEVIPAARAAEFGLLHRLVAPADLDETTKAVVEELRTGPAGALRQTKALIGQALDVSLSEAVTAEGEAQVVNAASPDAREAVRAFVERRPPRYIGS